MQNSIDLSKNGEPGGVSPRIQSHRKSPGADAARLACFAGEVRRQPPNTTLSSIVTGNSGLGMSFNFKSWINRLAN